MAQDVKTQISLYYTRFLKSQDSFRSVREKWAIMDTFDRGEQWKDSVIPPWVPKPVTNYIRFIRTLKRANLASAIPKTTFSPVYPDDVDNVDRLQQAHDHVWDSEKVFLTIRESVDRSLLQGTALVRVWNDTSYTGGRYYGENDARNQLYQGRIQVERWPGTNFFPDPDAYCLEKCKWVETTEILTMAEVKENPAFIKYCTANKTIKKLKNLETDQLDRTDDSSGDIFKRDVKVTDNSPAIQGDEMVTLHTHWERYYRNGKWHLDVTYYLRNTDFFLLQLEDVQPSEFPFAVLYDEKEERSFWGSATCADILENQKIVNKTQQVASILGTLHQNPQKVVFRESGINAQEMAKSGNLPGKVWTSNVPANQAVQAIEPPDIPKGLFDLDDRTQQNIRNTVGINEAYTGQSVGSLTTSTGVADLIERATIRDKDKMLQIDAFTERISHLIALFVVHTWEDARPVSTQNADGTTNFQTFQPFDPITRNNLEWRVKSNVYAKAPMTQASKRQQADKLLQTQGQFQFTPPVITPEEWLQMQDFDNQTEIMRRMEADRATMQQQKATNMAKIIAQVAQQASQLMAQGLPPEQITQTITQIAQQLLDQQQASEMKNGVAMQKETTGPKGVTSQVAMANMANGG